MAWVYMGFQWVGGRDCQQKRAASPSLLVLDPHSCSVNTFPPIHTFFSYLWERLLSWWGCDGHGSIIRPQEC